MPSVFWIGVALVILADMVFLVFVVRRKLSQTGLGFGVLRDVTREVHERVGQWAPGNYSGNVEDLPHLIATLVPMAAEIAVGKGLTIDQNTLELLVCTSIAAHKLAPRPAIDAARHRLREQNSTRAA